VQMPCWRLSSHCTPPSRSRPSWQASGSAASRGMIRQIIRLCRNRLAFLRRVVCLDSGAWRFSTQCALCNMESVLPVSFLLDRLTVAARSLNVPLRPRGASAKFIRRRDRGHCLGGPPRTATASAPDDAALPARSRRSRRVLRMLLAYLAVAHMPRASLFPSRIRRGQLCCKYLMAQTCDTICEAPCTRDVHTRGETT